MSRSIGEEPVLDEVGDLRVRENEPRSLIPNAEWSFGSCEEKNNTERGVHCRQTFTQPSIIAADILILFCSADTSSVIIERAANSRVR
jgi:hypothetical protein